VSGAGEPTGGEPERRCPICGKPATPDAFPFCSKRCADLDLHRWLSDGYAIPGQPVPESARDPDEN